MAVIPKTNALVPWSWLLWFSLWKAMKRCPPFRTAGWPHLRPWLPLPVFSSCASSTFDITGHTPVTQGRGDTGLLHFLSTHLPSSKGLRKEAYLAFISSGFYVLKGLVYHTCTHKELSSPSCLPLAFSPSSSVLLSIPPLKRCICINGFRWKAVTREGEPLPLLALSNLLQCQRSW